MEKFILIARDENTLSEMSKQIPHEQIETGIHFQNINELQTDILPPEVNVGGIEKYSEGGGIKVLLAIDIGKPKNDSFFGLTFYRRLSLAVARYLKKINLPFTFWSEATPEIHIYGKFPEVKAEGCKDKFRTPKTLGLFNEVFNVFNRDFEDKELDIWITSATDTPEPALEFSKALDTKVFTYCTTHSMNDRVIAFPDFNSCYNEEKFFNPFITTSKCKEASLKPYEDNKIFWRGALLNFARRCLYAMGKRYPEQLKIEDSYLEGRYMHMTEQARYKYLIDIRGHGWSGRLQTLLQLGRPVFIVERPFREWYFDRMIPWKNYIPVKEDLSDLIEKYEFMERHPEIYQEIVYNMKIFTEKNLTPNRILIDTRDLILKYGVVND